MALVFSDLVESVDELTRATAQRDGYDDATLIITGLSVLATVAAVIVALVSARSATKTANDAEGVARDAAESARLSAAAAADMLRIEQSRVETEYKIRRATAAEKLIGALSNYRQVTRSKGFTDWEDHAHNFQSAVAAIGSAAGAVELACKDDDITVATSLRVTLERVTDVGTKVETWMEVEQIEQIIIDWHRGGSVNDATGPLQHIGNNMLDTERRLNDGTY